MADSTLRILTAVQDFDTGETINSNYLRFSSSAFTLTRLTSANGSEYLSIVPKSGGLVTSVSATAPLVATPSGTAVELSLPAATASNNGYATAAQAGLLAGATPAKTALALVRRDADSSVAFGAVTSSIDAGATETTGLLVATTETAASAQEWSPMVEQRASLWNGLSADTVAFASQVETTVSGATWLLKYKLNAGAWTPVFGVDASGNVGIVNVLSVPTLDHTGSLLGFFGNGPVAQPTITGSRGGNVALENLLSGLNDLGLIIDNTTA